MGILTNIFGNNKKLPFKKTIRFERKESEFEVNIGDELKIWNKPNTTQLNLYAKGSAGGDGFVGTTFNSVISHHLNKTENLFVENKVVGLTKKLFKKSNRITKKNGLKTLIKNTTQNRVGNFASILKTKLEKMTF